MTAGVFALCAKRLVKLSPQVKKDFQNLKPKSDSQDKAIPFDDKQSITNDPESEDVTKYRTIPKSEKTDKKRPTSPYDLIMSNHICSVE